MICTIILALVVGGGILQTSFDPQLSTQEWDFESVMVYGDDEDEILGKNVANVVATNGSYYLLDTQLEAVTRIFPDGTYEMIFISGEGPGECTKPMNMIQWPDEFHLGVYSPYPPGKLVNNFGTCTKWPDCSCPHNFSFGLNESLGRHIIYNPTADLFVINLLEVEIENLEAERGVSYYRMSLFDGGGKRVVDVYQEAMLYMPGLARFPHWWVDTAQRAFAPQSLFFVPDDSYTINQYSFEGNLLQSITQDDYPRREMTLAEEEYYLSLDRYAPDIYGLYWLDDRLLVLTSHGLVGESLSFDSYSFGDEVKMSRVVLLGVRPSPTARYFWLHKDCLAVVYGAMQASVGTSETHEVEIYQRSEP